MNAQRFFPPRPGRTLYFALLSISILAAGCDNGRTAGQQSQISEKDREIERLSALSKQQSEQIAKLKDALKAKGQSEQVQTERKPSIFGTAYVSRKSGDSTLLRDLRVSVFSADIESMWREIVKDDSKYKNQLTYDPLRASSLNVDVGVFMMQLALRQLAPVVEVNTDADGKFVVGHLPEGHYTVFAHLDTKGSSVVWVLPVDVRRGESAKLNITNSTARFIANNSP